MKLEQSQIGSYEPPYQPTHCALTGSEVNAGAVQFGLDHKHYVLVSQSSAHLVTDKVRNDWRKQVTPKSPKKTNKMNEDS